MASASYPVGSAPATSERSFLVHLQSLTDISRELQTQIDGLTRPVDVVGDLLAAPPAFGPFAEAATLTSWSTEAATQLGGLLGDVRSAMQFADEVTRTVATGYARADDDVAWSVAGNGAVGTVVGTATRTAGAAVGAVGGITAGVAHAVGETVHGATDALGSTVQGVTHTVADAGGAILGALAPQRPDGAV